MRLRDKGFRGTDVVGEVASIRAAIWINCRKQKCEMTLSGHRWRCGSKIRGVLPRKILELQTILC